MMSDLNVDSQRPATSPHESVTLDFMHSSTSSIDLHNIPIRYDTVPSVNAQTPLVQFVVNLL